MGMRWLGCLLLMLALSCGGGGSSSTPSLPPGPGVLTAPPIAFPALNHMLSVGWMNPVGHTIPTDHMPLHPRAGWRIEGQRRRIRTEVATMPRTLWILAMLATALGCGSGGGGTPGPSTTPTHPTGGPPAGNPEGHFPVPPEARAEDVSSPTTVIGTGTPESCTAEAFIAAVAKGGKIVFNGGTQPFTLTLPRPAKVFNNQPDLVIDGGGVVTLSGGGRTRILYLNTCDPAQIWTTDHCQNQEHPQLTVQNLTFIDGSSVSETTYDGGGAIWVRGGRFKVVNCRFFNNVCASTGPDVGGGALRVFSQYNGLPVYVVNSTFGGAPGYGNVGANGGGLSSIGVSWSIYNCLFSHNRAIGSGGNPAQSGTPGGGSGGAIYNDGNTMRLALYGTLIEANEVNAHGSAIFFITNDRSGTLHIQDSVIRKNIGGSWYTLPGISMHPETKREIVNSVIQ